MEGKFHRLMSLWIFLVYVTSQSFGQNYNITPISTSSGLYYEKIGDVLLSNNNWEFVTSVDYGGYLVFFEYLHNQAQKFQEFCQDYKVQDCEERVNTIRTTMEGIEEVDAIMANFLGIERRRRVKRFWQAFLTLAPYILEPLGKELPKYLFGNNMDNERLEAYGQEIQGLRDGQENLANQLEYQRTTFLIDSERRDNRTAFLERTQAGIKNDLKMLQSSVILDSAEKEARIKELNEMLADTNGKLKSQQQRLDKTESDIENIKAKILEVNDDIKTLKQDIAVNKGSIEAVAIETKLNSLSINLNFLLERFRAEQKILLDVINNANRGFLDPYIVTPVNLIDMMRSVESKLPERTRFPFHPNITNAANLYKIIKPTVYLHKNQIMFILRMPLVHASSFEIYKMTSLPMLVEEEKFVFVSPKTDYLFINEHQNLLSEYVLTSAANFREFCTEIARNKFICEQIQETSVGLRDCEVRIFLNEKAGSCDARVVKLEKTVFLQLQQYASWIYVVPKPDRIILSCGKERFDRIITGTGILRLSNHNCTVRTSNVALNPITGSKPAVVTKIYIPEEKLTDQIDLSFVENYVGSASLDHKQVILPSDNNELQRISEKIGGIKNTADESSVNYTLAIIIPVIVLAITLLMIVYRKRICRGADAK